jgi:hypothetical protein
MSTLQTITPSFISNRLVVKIVTCLRSVLVTFLLLGVFNQTHAAVINALDCSLNTVQTAVAAASPGDTVQIAAGTAVWTNTLNIYKDIQVIGAGLGQTVITNDVVGQLVNWSTTSDGFCRLSGIDFEAGPPDAVPNSTTRAINIGGTCHAFRLDDCMFNGLNEYNLWFGGWVYGVVDHCTFNVSGSSLIQVQMDAYGGQQYGDGSWADVDSFGTTNAIYFETCNFNGPVGQHIGMLDGDHGDRVVVRYCNSTNCPIGSHGTDNGGRIRGLRSYEIYNNNFIYQTDGGADWGQCIYMRSGTAVVWGNTISGGYSYAVALADYRFIPVVWDPFRNVTGANPWDSNNPTLFDLGNASGPNGSGTLVDTTKNWTPNQWANSTFPYILYNVTQGIGASISGNTANTITFNGSFNGYPGNNSSGTMLINQGDSYQIRQVYATLDQCGFGEGDLLTGTTPVNTVTGTASWPNEVPDPVYVWNNNFNFSVSGYPSGLIAGNSLNYVAGVPKPGYTPLVYPHPLVTATGTPSGTTSTPGNSAVAPPSNLQAHAPTTNQ